MNRLVALLIVWACAAAAPAAETEWLANLDLARERAQTEGCFLLAYFCDPNSPLCKRFQAETLGSPMLAGVLKGFIKARVEAANVTSPGGRHAVALQIRQFPTVVFYDAQGRELDRFTGFREPATFLRLAAEAVDPQSNYVLLKERLKVNPRDIEALYFMGRKYQRRGDPVQAARYFDQVADLDPRNEAGFADNLLLRRAERLQQETKFEQAMEMIRRHDEQFPDGDEADFAAYLKARLLWLLNRPEEALAGYAGFAREYPLSDFKPQALAALKALAGGASSTAPTQPATNPAAN